LLEPSDVFPIIEALLDGNAERASAAMAKHLEAVDQLLAQIMFGQK
jgi:DNA-binding GntR family transcriptional regulator